MTTPTLHGPPAIQAALQAARSAGATPVGCQVTGRRVEVRVSCPDDLEALAFAHPGSGVEGQATRYLEVVVGGRRVVFWAEAA